MRRLALAWGTALAVLLGMPCPLFAQPAHATPAIHRTLPPLAVPKRPLRATYVVEVNKLGQVTRVRSVTASKDPKFDAMTYGNSLQAFIRKEDGSAISGVYELSYDYDPKTSKVRRAVKLVQTGGVNADAEGAVVVETRKSEKRKRDEDAKTAATKAAAKPLPDFNKIVTAAPSPSGH